VGAIDRSNIRHRFASRRACVRWPLAETRPTRGPSRPASLRRALFAAVFVRFCAALLIVFLVIRGFLYRTIAERPGRAQEIRQFRGELKCGRPSSRRHGEGEEKVSGRISITEQSILTPFILLSRAAGRECAAFHKRTGRIIKLLTVQEILDEEHVQKM
jgi:hypothetical protein